MLSCLSCVVLAESPYHRQCLVSQAWSRCFDLEILAVQKDHLFELAQVDKLDIFIVIIHYSGNLRVIRRFYQQ